MSDLTGMNANGLCREKYWSELTDSERIERMRQEVKRCQQDIAMLIRAVIKLERHEHKPDGTLMVPYNENGLGYPCPEIIKSDLGKEYF
jgi:hypothetical protein